MTSAKISASFARRDARVGWAARLVAFALFVFSTLPTMSCSRDSYLVVRVKAATGTFVGVHNVNVTVTDTTTRTLMATRTFTVAATGGVAIDATNGKTFSVSFVPERSGPVDVAVTISDANSCIGNGSQLDVPLNKGGVTSTVVTLRAGAGCNTTFMGCDPAVIGSCPTGKTCFVDCTKQVGVCVTSGAKRPGEACGDNSDCAPGSQCFDYGCGSGTKYCLKFCSGDADCTGSTTVAAVSTCSDPVVCPPQTTYRTCGFVCDPRGSGATGCPAGLTCFLFKSPNGVEDAPACGCKAQTRVGVDGTACSVAEDCAAGFLCDQMLGGTFCRRICQMSAPADCPTGKSCMPLLNNTTFGVCL